MQPVYKGEPYVYSISTHALLDATTHQHQIIGQFYGSGDLTIGGCLAVSDAHIPNMLYTGGVS